jgi:hypothetical protein
MKIDSNTNLLVIFGIVFLVLFFALFIMNDIIKKQIERFGIYCGSYGDQMNCSKDSNCIWRTTQGNGWCDQKNQSS